MPVGGAVGAFVGVFVGALVGVFVGRLDGTGRPIGDVGVGVGVDDGRPIGGAVVPTPGGVDSAVAAGVGDAMITGAGVVVTTRFGVVASTAVVVGNNALAPPPPLQPAKNGVHADTIMTSIAGRKRCLRVWRKTNTRSIGGLSHRQR